jgi:hypothetical protein
MSSLTILIIRHAEKPDEDWPGPGFTDKGQEDSESLVIRGWQCAGAWTALFGAGLGGDDFPTPQVVYAATPGAPNKLNHGPSRVPMRPSCRWRGGLRLYRALSAAHVGRLEQAAEDPTQSDPTDHHDVRATS